MTRNKRKDLAVFVGIIMTLVMCIISVMALDDLQRFENKKYSDVTSSSIMIMDLISPGESELYYEYKKEFESKIIQANIYFLLSLLSLGFTIGIALSSRQGLVTRPSG